MKLLIYGLQSSGASTLARLLAQRPGVGAFIDIWAMYAAPKLEAGEDIVAKVVITTAYPLAVHQRRFSPDYTILMLRHPIPNFRSLNSKIYRNHCGLIEEKFVMADSIFRDVADFSDVIYYEDLVFDAPAVIQRFSRMGWALPGDALSLPRQADDIVAFNEAHFPVLAGRLQYGSGRSRGSSVVDEFVDLRDLGDATSVQQLCPALAEHYEHLLAVRGTKWPVDK